MNLSDFEDLVEKAVDGLPPSIQDLLENVTVLVQHFPTREQMQANGVPNKWSLHGLYEGVPLTQRNTSYGMVLPDRITIFKDPLEAGGGSEEALTRRVQRTVLHEIAHHFGISDERLKEMGRY